jgi:hypothetical protein
LKEFSSKTRIIIGPDHAGFRAKESIKKYLEGAGYQVEDCGTHSQESVDNPDCRVRPDRRGVVVARFFRGEGLDVTTVKPRL